MRLKHTTLAAAAIFAGLMTFGFATAQAEEAAKPAPEAPAATAPAAANKVEVTDEMFIDAAYDNCATVENRSAKSCNCERKLIGDRVSASDKRMAYLYWKNKETFVKEFEVKKAADPAFPKDFSSRFSNLQALVIAACGT